MKKQDQRVMDSGASQCDVEAGRGVSGHSLTTSLQKRGAASSAESSADTVMNTMSSEELSWMDEQMRCRIAALVWDHFIEQPALVLVEIGAPRSKHVKHH